MNYVICSLSIIIVVIFLFIFVFWLRTLINTSIRDRYVHSSEDRNKVKGLVHGIVLDELATAIDKTQSNTNSPSISKENADEYFSSAKDLLYRFRVTPNPGWEYLSPSVYEITGFTREEHYKDSSIVFNTIHPDDRQILIDKVSNRLDYSKPRIQRWYKKDGSVVWLEEYCTPIYDDRGLLIAFDGVCRVVTERVEQDSYRNNLIINDPLTGLLNRRYFEQILSEINDNEAIGVIVIGIDGLRNINYNSDSFDAGDKAIIALSNILRNTYIENSILARTGSSDFAFLLRDLSGRNLEVISRSLLKSVLDYNNSYPNPPLQVSIGFARTREIPSKPQFVFLEADKKMYNHRINKNHLI